MKYLFIAIIALFVAGCTSVPELTAEQKVQIKDAVTKAVKDQLNK
jgi:starvation-inducible outer membrane lipoprotein